MKISPPIRHAITETVCALYTLLFVYAATSKFLDFENFQVQLGQSPVLGAFAGAVSYAVPILELAISILLWVPKTRAVALWCCYTLMLMFTAYIFIILKYSSFVPCSCGGVLEKMDWTTHLYFNLVFVLLAAAALLLPSQRKAPGCPVVMRLLFACTAGGPIIVLCLFLLSDTIIHQHNTFIRSFSYSPPKVHEADLGYNSYYLAGSNDKGIYLGNHTVPLLITEFSPDFKRQARHHVRVDTILPNSVLHLQVAGDTFYVTDGSAPIIYSGKCDGTWGAATAWRGRLPFTHIKFADAAHAAVRAYTKEGQSILATIDFASANATFKPGLLERQIDGVFDVDGILLHDGASKEFVYAHYYKNQLIVMDSALNLKRRNTTIDTVSRAAIAVARLQKKGGRMLSAPPLTVNHTAAADNGFIFVHSGLAGRYESRDMWNEASVIDVYSSRTNRYIFSFYVYHINGKKLRSFIVKNNHLYGLIGNHLVDYKLDKAMFGEGR